MTEARRRTAQRAKQGGDAMFMISMPKTFTVGQTADCRINREPAKVTWRDMKTLIIEPDDVRTILAVDQNGDLRTFVCSDAGKAEADYETEPFPDGSFVIGEHPDGYHPFVSNPKTGPTRAIVIHSPGEGADQPHKDDLAISVSYGPIWFGAYVAPERIDALKRDWCNVLPKLHNPDKRAGTRKFILDALHKGKYANDVVVASALVAALIWLAETSAIGGFGRSFHYEITDIAVSQNGRDVNFRLMMAAA
jgi:hypothetical protein